MIARLAAVWHAPIAVHRYGEVGTIRVCHVVMSSACWLVIGAFVDLAMMAMPS